MRRSTKLEGDRLRAALANWLTPAECDALLASYRAEFGKICGNDRNLQPWREAFHAVSFARAHEVKAMRIGDDPPDFIFRLPEGEFPIEITEVKSPHDLLGKDFIRWAELEEQGVELPQTSYDPTSDWENSPERIRQAVNNKARKTYPRDTILAVAVSGFWFGDSDPNTAEKIEAACAVGAVHFREVWLSIGSHHLKCP